jgi:hypothetical protein
MVCRVVDDSERHPGSLVEDLRRALDELEDLAARHIAQAGATKPRADSWVLPRGTRHVPKLSGDL